jgi:2',3'-cyclic-nucleotide 2'-phosphodiesterase (5'-nucleotidase family)
MTHIGYSQDMALAANTTGIDIILGGHSHSLLGDMAGAVGKYPTIIKNKDGEDVPVVTSSVLAIVIFSVVEAQLSVFPTATGGANTLATWISASTRQARL